MPRRLDRRHPRLSNGAVPFLLNPGLDRGRPYAEAERAILSLVGAREALAAISRWPGYAPTPLVPLPDLARVCGVAEVLVKHEGHRFGLKSFKALGGAYAVERLAAERGVDGLVVACATDGNHGRSVAWGARRAGAKAVIYVHEHVSQGRADAIAGYGADVVRAGATYDESVRLCAEAADAHGWAVVSDTSWPGYEEVPKTVMQGYAVLAMEAEAQGARPTHVFVQGGVGGLAAGVLSYRWEKLGAARPILTVVEPDVAACLFASAKAGAPTAFPGGLDTIMAGLACGEPSPVAWRILAPGVDAFMTVGDAQAAEAMRDVARAGLALGESGVAGLAGLRAATADDAARRTLGLDAASRVLCYGTEGATDAAVYERIVGRRPEEVEA
jgi:diaminopropionate ammonia-lyase